LGSGSFGVVYIARHIETDVLYALKTVPRIKIDYAKIYDHILREKSILLQLDFVFIIKLVKTFKDDQRLYFLTEFVDGVDLFDVISNIGILSEPQARFYGSCILLMLEHLDERSIAHRDLKPENIMVGTDGYPVLIDFGTAKVISERTFTNLGTPHYMAPEIIMGKGYNHSADLWSFGIILFEFIYGYLPFGEGENDV
jgi:cGMP-dependent protein kinase